MTSTVQEQFPVGTLVLIKVGSSAEQRLLVTHGIVQGEDRTNRDTLRIFKGNQEVSVPRAIMVPVAQLSPEDYKRDPETLLREQPDLCARFWEVYGNELRKVVAPEG
jgi:hypothetical protein